MEKEQASGKRIGKEKIYHALSVSILLASLLLSVFYFRPVFWRVLESFKDFGLSVGYYFTELLGFEGVITPTVAQIPHGATEVLPFEPAEFQSGLSKFFRLLIDKDNALSFLMKFAQTISRAAKVLILLLPVFVLLYFVIKNAYRRTNNDYNADTKPLRIYKKIEAATWNKVKYFVSEYINFLRDRKIYCLAAGLLWTYNLNAITILTEAFAYVFYFAVSFDVLHIYTQVAKLAMDLTVAIDFLPWWMWVVFGWLLFDHIRKERGLKVLQSYEVKDRAFLEGHPGALFVVGKQRAKKTTTITSMALSQASVFREKAREKLRERDLQFPFFPWINLEKVIEYGIENGSLPTLARVRRFIRYLKTWFYECPGGTRKHALKMLKKRYGYTFGDFIFGYDYNRYGLTYDNNLYIADIFESLENYAQSYWIYAAPTPLIVANYAIRTDTQRIDNGNFPLFDDDFFSRSSKELKKEYCHILDYNAMRLGKLKGENDPYKDGFEIGVAAEMEHAKERGNQHTRTGKKDSPDCNQHNDLFELDVKMHGHAATIDNYTYFRMLLDDQRADSLAADDKDLCDIIMIKKTSEAKIVMPGFAIEEALYLITTRLFDKVYYNIRNLRGDNTLFVYLLKKLYSPINNHYVRIFNQYSIYTSTLRVRTE